MVSVSALGVVILIQAGAVAAPPPLDMPFKAARKAALGVTANLYLSRSAQMEAMREHRAREVEAQVEVEAEVAADGEAPFVIVGEEFEAEELGLEPEPEPAAGEDTP